jgi:hypothetical protein
MLVMGSPDAPTSVLKAICLHTWSTSTREALIAMNEAVYLAVQATKAGDNSLTTEMSSDGKKNPPHKKVPSNDRARLTALSAGSQQNIFTPDV